jgi:hypothetical protein
MGIGDGPGRGKADQRVAGILFSGGLGSGDAVPGYGERFEMETRTGQTNIEGVESLNAGIFQMIFGVDVNDRLRQGVEDDAYFLFFDDVAGAEGGVASSQRARCEGETQKWERRRMRGARHN